MCATGIGGAELISRDGSIHLGRPGVDPPHQILHILESLLNQEIRRIGASHAMVADGNDLRVAVQPSERLRECSKGN